MTSNTPADPKTVFLVEDDSSALDLYRNRLAEAGFRTASAFGVEEAREALPTLSADLIIVDLMLPKPGGLPLLEAIRLDERHKGTPILVLSNAYMPELAQRALRAGGNRALPRNECTSSELISVSRSLIGLNGTDSAEQSAAFGQLEETAEAASTGELKRALVEGGGGEIAAIRELCVSYSERAGSEEGKGFLSETYKRVRLFSTRSGLAGYGKIAQLTGALEAMLFDQLFRLKGAMSPSSIQTLLQAVDCLDRLFSSGNVGSAEPACQGSVLLVDDDAICNMANQVALNRANYDCAITTDSSSALNLIDDHTFDLILLDIDMPGTNGIELCRKLRGVPHHQNTPVIFVTLHSDFQKRAQSVQSGGDDLISKPISPLELIVKATVFLFSTNKPPVPDQPPRYRSPAAKSADPIQTAKSNGKDSKLKPGLSSQTANGAGAKVDSDPLNRVSAQESFYEKLKNLKEALAEETKRRAAVELQAAENKKRRTELEAAIQENQQSQQRFHQMLEESQKQALAAEEGKGQSHRDREGRRRALVELSDFVSDKLFRLKKALAEETKRREALEQQIAENANRRAELEAALAEIQGVEAAFQEEMGAAENPQQLLALQSSLAQSQQAREALAAELEAARRELESFRSGQVAKDSELEAKARELQASHAEVELKVQTLTEALAAERENSKRQQEIEDELAGHNQVLAQLRQELDDIHSQRKLLEASVAAEQSKLEARKHELDGAQTEAAQEVTKLTAALAAETERREGLKRQAAEHARYRGEIEAALAENRLTEKALQLEIEASINAKRRGELEAELAENKQIQSQLRLELDEAQKQLRAQLEQNSSAQVATLEARANELQAAHAEVTQRLQRLTETLTEETWRREVAEQQVTEIGQRRSDLEAELNRVQQHLEEARKRQEEQLASSQAEQSRIEEHKRELQAAQAEVEKQVARLTESLAQETKRREGAEQQASQVGQQRGELEAELTRLQQQLEEAQKRQEEQQASSRAEQSRIEARTQELQAARAEVEKQVAQLTETLAEEAKRRAGAEQQAGEIGQRRSELEAQLAKLQQELVSSQEQQLAQEQSSRVEQAKLQAKMHELQANQTTVEERIKALLEALAAETKRREAAEQRATSKPSSKHERKNCRPR